MSDHGEFVRRALVAAGSIASEDLVCAMAVDNALGERPWVVDLTAVGEPDDGLVALSAVQGTVHVAADWPIMPYTERDGDVERSLLIKEQRRLAATAKV